MSVAAGNGMFGGPASDLGVQRPANTPQVATQDVAPRQRERKRAMARVVQTDSGYEITWCRYGSRGRRPTSPD
jgi:hypothetical protein